MVARGIRDEELAPVLESQWKEKQMRWSEGSAHVGLFHSNAVTVNLLMASVIVVKTIKTAMRLEENGYVGIASQISTLLLYLWQILIEQGKVQFCIHAPTNRLWFGLNMISPIGAVKNMRGCLENI